MSKHRLIEFDVMTGITILFVIYGHMLFDGNLPTWYIQSRSIIYRFHMPVFMFISGFLISYSYKPIHNRDEYLSFIKRKVLKFVPTYILLSALFILLKILINGSSIAQTKIDIYTAILVPLESPSGFLWYVYVLLQYYLIFPILNWLANKNIIILILIGLVFQFVKVTTLLNLDLFSFYLIFIIFGIITDRYYNAFKLFISKFGFVILMLTALVFLFDILSSKLILGILMILSIYYLSLILVNLKIKNHLSFLGKNAYQIYIWHTLVMGFTYIFFTRILKLEVSVVVLSVVFLSGVISPLIIAKAIIEKNSILSNFFK